MLRTQMQYYIENRRGDRKDRPLSFMAENDTMHPEGHVAELVYAYVSEAYGESLGSSNLSSGTIIVLY